MPPDLGPWPGLATVKKCELQSRTAYYQVVTIFTAVVSGHSGVPGANPMFIENCDTVMVRSIGDPELA